MIIVISTSFTILILLPLPHHFFNMKTKSIIFLVLVFIGVVSIAYLFINQNKFVPVNSESEFVHENVINEFVLEDNSGCYNCHGNMRDIKGTHAQAGCISCHQGNGKAQTKEAGHLDMVSVPGNFSDMEETCGACHAESIHHVMNSIMATNSGLVNVDRYIFGERETPDGHSDIKDIGQTAADNHVRMLCGRCHLGKEKEEVGPVNQLSRGGGCTACHSNYSKGALASHEHLSHGSIDSATFHPTITVHVSSDHCFGCHSRSGRISTNYEGWHETMYRDGDSLPKEGNFRLLEDGRYFTAMEEDLHHGLGLQCIDCHVYSGVMGDGKLYMHEEDAVKISCEDCHFDGVSKTTNYSDLSDRDKRIYSYRKYDHSEMLTVHKDNTALINSYINEDGKPVLKSKFSDVEYLLSAPSSSCVRTHGHSDVTCSACHSAWAPQCMGCHVEYDSEKRGYDLFAEKRVQGTWVESAGGFFAGLPSLGVYRNDTSKSITSSVPGMIMTLDQSGYHGKSKEDSEFFRLFAPSKPHTTSQMGRDCKSCHNDPVALGYGRGELKFVIEGIPHWEFEPEYESSEDGLPMDAWIPFLGVREGKVSTRLNYTPFTITEQQRVLAVGACLTCHSSNSQVMANSLRMDFKLVLEQMSDECRKPVFIDL